MEGSLNINILAFRSSIVAADTLSVSLSSVLSTSVNGMRMEKHNISSLHSWVNLRSSLRWHISDSPISSVNSVFPFWVSMFQELSLVGSRIQYQTSIISGHIFHSSPGTNNSVGWSEGEVSQILMEWMSLGGSHIGWFIDQHGVYGFNIFSNDVLDVWKNSWVFTEGKENFIILPILDFIDLLES